MMQGDLARLVQEERHRELAEVRHRASAVRSRSGRDRNMVLTALGRIFRPRPTPDLERARTAVVIRLAGPADAGAIAYLAALEDSPSPAGPTLVAIVDDRIEDALPLEGGAPVANPFAPSGQLAELLTLRAEQLAA